MKRNKARGRERFLIVFFVLALSCTSVSTAYATSLASIAVDSLGAIAAAEISCHKDQIFAGIKGIFSSGVKDTVSGQIESAASNTIPVTIVHDSATAERIADNAAVTANNLTCTKAVERAAAQVILKQLTVATVNWINHGFKGGSSFFPKDTHSFLKAIGDQATAKFIGNIGYDSKNYPFGRAVAQSLVQQLSNNFEQQAQYSLDRVLAQWDPNTTPPTVADFERSFIDGGWAAFHAQFDIGNNPIGFRLSAEGELAQRRAYTDYNPAQDIRDQLARSGGFLDTSVCVAPSTYVDDGSSDKIAAETQAKINALPDDASSEPEYERLKKIKADNTCTQHALQTPGSVVGATLNKALGSPFDQLGLGQDLTADLTAVFNALANQLMQKGLSTLAAKDDQTQYENNGSYVNPAIDVTGGAGGPNLNGSWSSKGGSFNVFKDIPTVMLNESYVPTGSNDPRPEGFQQVLTKQLAVATHLIPQIYMLDFCVPGPHIGWQTDTATNLQKFLGDSNQVPANADAAVSQGAKVLSKIANAVDFLGIKNASADKRNEKLYAIVVGQNLSYNAPLPTDDNFDPNAPYANTPTEVSVARNLKVNGRNSVVNIFNTLYKRYSAAVDSLYNPDNNPDVALELGLEYAEDQTEFAKVPKYQQAISDNKALITSSIATSSQLQSLLDRIAALPSLPGYIDHTANFTPDHDRGYWYQQDLLAANAQKSLSNLTQYQIELKRISGTFNLVSPKIHDVDDIAKEESALSALSDVYDNFSGPNGYVSSCVKNTSDPKYTGPKSRMFFPLIAVVTLPVTTGANGYDGQKAFIDFENSFKDVGISFLPDWQYAQGVSTVGPKQIQNDDVVTIDHQPVKDAMAGLEATINIY